MDDRAAGFVTAFQAFLDEVVQAHRSAAALDGSALVPALREHLGTDPRELPVVTEEVPPHLFVDLDVALAEVQQRGGPHRVLGIGGGEQRRHSSLSEILDHAGRYHQFPLGAVDYASVATGPDTTRQAVSFGLRLFTVDGAPVAVLQRAAEPRFGSTTARMEILTPAAGVAATLISTVRDLMIERSVLRGQVLSLGGSTYEPGIGGITFHRRPTLPAEDIVLPAGVLDRVERHVAGVATHRDRLRAAASTSSAGCCCTARPGPARPTPSATSSAGCRR
ncbi:MAG TPA: hypothetical protein VES42_28160 [Pilimelia sp.]|nr:hypothetical protein [Pilimelia sp.]